MPCREQAQSQREEASGKGSGPAKGPLASLGLGAAYGEGTQVTSAAQVGTVAGGCFPQSSLHEEEHRRARTGRRGQGAPSSELPAQL